MCPDVSPTDTAVEAASWLLAAELARRLGPHFRLIEGHPAGGQYDVLWFLPVGATEPQILINRRGSIHVHPMIAGQDSVIADSNVWHDLIFGGASIVEIADWVCRALAARGVTVAAPDLTTAGRVYEIIAAGLRLAALHRVPWRCLWGVLDTSGFAHGDERHYLFRPYQHELVDVGWRDDEFVGNAEGYWFIVGAGDTPIACLSVDGYVYLPDGGGVEIDVTYPEPAPAWLVAGELLGASLRASEAFVDGHDLRPGLALPTVLSELNRKERFFLLGAATGTLNGAELSGPGMTPAPAFRAALGVLLGAQWEPPGHAWMAMDYHLSWLHAGLQWWRGAVAPGQLNGLPLIAPPVSGESSEPTDPAWVTGDQEDCDLLVCWQDGDLARLVLVEAKAYGAWGARQIGSKMRRVAAIYSAAGGTGSGLELRLVLTSPRKPQKLAVANWPQWAVLAGEDEEAPAASWFTLAVPPLRVRPERCDARGRASAQGAHWRLVGPGR